jgi:hypothetical protein
MTMTDKKSIEAAASAGPSSTPGDQRLGAEPAGSLGRTGPMAPGQRWSVARKREVGGAPAPAGRGGGGALARAGRRAVPPGAMAGEGAHGRNADVAKYDKLQGRCEAGRLTACPDASSA